MKGEFDLTDKKSEIPIKLYYYFHSITSCKSQFIVTTRFL